MTDGDHAEPSPARGDDDASHCRDLYHAQLTEALAGKARSRGGSRMEPLGSWDMPNADDMLKVAASRADRLAAPGLSPQPRRKVAVLSCMDTRIDLFPMLGLERGDAHIVRNAGGLVTDDAIRSLSVSQRLLGTEEIVVVMHHGCGLL